MSDGPRGRQSATTSKRKRKRDSGDDPESKQGKPSEHKPKKHPEQPYKTVRDTINEMKGEGVRLEDPKAFLSALIDKLLKPGGSPYVFGRTGKKLLVGEESNAQMQRRRRWEHDVCKEVEGRCEQLEALPAAQKTRKVQTVILKAKRFLAKCAFEKCAHVPSNFSLVAACWSMLKLINRIKNSEKSPRLHMQLARWIELYQKRMKKAQIENDPEVKEMIEEIFKFWDQLDEDARAVSQKSRIKQPGEKKEEGKQVGRKVDTHQAETAASSNATMRSDSSASEEYLLDLPMPPLSQPQQDSEDIVAKMGQSHIYRRDESRAVFLGASDLGFCPGDGGSASSTNKEVQRTKSSSGSEVGVLDYERFEESMVNYPLYSKL